MFEQNLNLTLVTSPVKLKALAEDPVDATVPSGRLALYAKDKAGVSTLYYKDSSGVIHDLGLAGAAIGFTGTVTPVNSITVVNGIVTAVVIGARSRGRNSFSCSNGQRNTSIAFDFRKIVVPTLFDTAGSSSDWSAPEIATFDGSITSNVLTVTGTPVGTIQVGMGIDDGAGSVYTVDSRTADIVYIVSLGTGTGGTGTYNTNSTTNRGAVVGLTGTHYNRIVYTGVVTKIFQVSASLLADCHGGALHVDHAIAKGASGSAPTVDESTKSGFWIDDANDISFSTGTGFISMATNDYLEHWFKGVNTSGDYLHIWHTHLMAVQVD